MPFGTSSACTTRSAHERRVEVFGPVELEWRNARSYYFYDPDGNLLEFWSPNSASSRVAL